ncbi:NADPH-dependent FMN reductase [Streptomyces sp. 1331.2]|uniref:NADPH-dependent FMN reductase n=1 Tax=Streptomyces sp. 1331.2 TaxID=1938835 RepID=UPI000BDD0F45|nr:NAD(P)H-dependent oxidoreductase [Streptomyces sp. 1331.2]SOB88706.1 NAD(P)H-dependent FMN reductase [Streptomyces sp. 1331.2]
MTRTPLRLAVIIASTRQGRFAPTVAHWFTRTAEQRADLDIDVIDLAEHPLAHLGEEATPEQARHHAALTPRLAAADAFVVITPEYNHSFPAALKNAIDLHRNEWHAKPVGFVSYGGLGGGLRAVEQLRLVFAELHAATVRDTVSFHNVWSLFDQDGEPLDATIQNGAAKGMLDQLTWWAHALRNARTTHPYNA